MKRFAWYAGFVVAAHIPLVSWHLMVVSRIHLGLTAAQIAWFTFLTSLLPVTAVVLLHRGYNRIGGCLLAIALGVGLAIGGYEHFLSAGPDNIFRMPPGEYAAAFRASSVFLLLFELTGCAIGVKAFTAVRSEPS